MITIEIFQMLTRKKIVKIEPATVGLEPILA